MSTSADGTTSRTDLSPARPRKPRRSLTAVTVLLLAGAGLAAAPLAAASTDTSESVVAGSEPEVDSPPGPRPADPDVECVTGGRDVVELPAPQVRLGADGSWLITRGEGVTVGVVDSGVDPWNPQLLGQVDAGVDTMFDGSTGNADCLGQGTAVAGLVAGLPVDGIGFHGVAPAARIFPVRIVADELAVSAGAIATGIDTAVAGGAQVVLVTLSSPTKSAALDDAVAAAAAADVLVVAPAVLGTDSPAYGYPAAYDEVLAVGSVDEAGASPDDESPTSPIIDLVAPGTGVVSLLPGKGHTTALTGAVPAAAYVAGAAALVRSAHPELTADQVIARLEATADRPGTQPPDPLLGWGVVNVQVALSAIIATETADPVPAGAVVVRPPHAAAEPDRTTTDRAIWIFVIGVVLSLALLVAVVVVPRGRRTSWRPTRSSTVLPRRG